MRQYRKLIHDEDRRPHPKIYGRLFIREQPYERSPVKTRYPSARNLDATLLKVRPLEAARRLNQTAVSGGQFPSEFHTTSLHAHRISRTCARVSTGRMLV